MSGSVGDTLMEVIRKKILNSKEKDAIQTLEGLAKTCGVSYRFVHKDGEDFIVTFDYISKRFNLTSIDGVITKVTIG